MKFFFGYIEDATKTLPGAAAPGELHPVSYLDAVPLLSSTLAAA